MVQIGDWVRLKAEARALTAGTLMDTESMVVVRIARTCDGTGGDGAGLYCRWLDPIGWTAHGWLSESSVELVTVGEGRDP